MELKSKSSLHEVIPPLTRVTPPYVFLLWGYACYYCWMPSSSAFASYCTLPPSLPIHLLTNAIYHACIIDDIAEPLSILSMLVSISGVARECFMVGHVIAGAYAVQGGSGGMLPQKNLNFRPSKAVFGAF